MGGNVNFSNGFLKNTHHLVGRGRHGKQMLQDSWLPVVPGVSVLGPGVGRGGRWGRRRRWTAVLCVPTLHWSPAPEQSRSQDTQSPFLCFMVWLLSDPTQGLTLPSLRILRFSEVLWESYLSDGSGWRILSDFQSSLIPQEVGTIFIVFKKDCFA